MHSFYSETRSTEYRRLSLNDDYHYEVFNTWMRIDVQLTSRVASNRSGRRLPGTADRSLIGRKAVRESQPWEKEEMLVNALRRETEKTNKEQVQRAN